MSAQLEKWHFNVDHDFYASRHPTAEEVMLIIEVSDPTLLTDRNVKVPLYARADIPEMWLINLPNRIIEVYSQPAAGAYRNSTTFGPGEVLSSSSLADHSISVDDLIG